MSRRGRPKLGPGVRSHVWAMVELTRDRPSPSVRRLSTRQATVLLAKKLDGYAGLEAETIRRLHKQFDRELRTVCGSGYERRVADMLQPCRERREAMGWDTNPLELVL